MLRNPLPNGDSSQFSIVIAAHNDWEPLEQCLRSLAQQTNGPRFEVIVVDDGSRETAPESIRQWQGTYPLSIIRQSNAGIASARNRGVQESKGQILLFTDADCRFEPDCLLKLAETIAAFPEHGSFQLHLTGDSSTLLGRAELLRLIAIQEQTLQPDGRIRFLNTSGFAIRRSHKSVDTGPFDITAIRGEDTLLLATLMQQGELPLFVRNAKVRHSVSLSILECVRKDLRSGWLDGITFKAVAEKGVRVRMTNKDRIRMLYSTWKTSRDPMIGHLAWLVLTSRQLLERSVTVLYQCLPGR
ncbi:MAG: glycosyltransferase family 2 protein [Candidatus Sulfotelmatobacter sp.]